MSKVLSFKIPEKEINFKIFARSVAEGRLSGAARTFRDLVQCDLAHAQKVVTHFRKKYEESPSIVMQTMQIKSFLEQGQQNKALLAIQKIFGVSPVESFKVLDAMKAQMQI